MTDPNTVESILRDSPHIVRLIHLATTQLELTMEADGMQPSAAYRQGVTDCIFLMHYTGVLFDDTVEKFVATFDSARAMGKTAVAPLGIPQSNNADWEKRNAHVVKMAGLIGEILVANFEMKKGRLPEPEYGDAPAETVLWCYEAGVVTMNLVSKFMNRIRQEVAKTARRAELDSLRATDAENQKDGGTL